MLWPSVDCLICMRGKLTFRVFIVGGGGTFKPVHAMNFCGWPDMRSLQFPIFLNLKCYKRRHFHLSELWLNCEKKKSFLFIFFKWRIRSIDMIQIFWSRILTQYVWQVWVMARRACWGQELMCWAKWVTPVGGVACRSWMDELLKFQSASRLENVSGQDMHSDNFHPKSFNDRISILVEKDTILHMDSFALTLIFGAEIW